MKPLFAIDLTEDMNNEKMNGEEFLSRALTTAEQGGVSVLESLDKAETDTENETEEKSKNKKKEKKISRREKKAEKQRQREDELYDKKTQQTIAMRGALATAYTEVGVPEDAEDVDIFSFSYVIKKEKITPVIPENGYTEYVNLPMKIYVKDRRLYLADLSRVYSFSLDSVRKITKVKAKTEFPFWNKKMPYNDSLYKPYKIKRRIGNIYLAKYHYALTLEEGDQECQILFAPYELSIFERLAEVSAWKD